MLILAHKTFLTLVNLNKINRHILFNSLRRGEGIVMIWNTWNRKVTGLYILDFFKTILTIFFRQNKKKTLIFTKKYNKKIVHENSTISSDFVYLLILLT